MVSLGLWCDDYKMSSEWIATVLEALVGPRQEQGGGGQPYWGCTPKWEQADAA